MENHLSTRAFVFSSFMFFFVQRGSLFMLKSPQCAKYDAEFSVVCPNSRIPFGINETIHASNLEECLTKCLFHPVCRSVNFYGINGTCVVIDHNYLIPKQILQEDDGWNYYATKQLDFLGNKCEEGRPSCQSNERCQDKCDPPYYQCVQRYYKLTAVYNGAEQSTTSGVNYNAARAIDGDYGTFSHTLAFNPGWWRLIFKHIVRIYSVHLYNRSCCAERSLNSDIIIYTDIQRTTSMVCANVGNMSGVLHKELICQQLMEGIVLEISTPESTEFHEVEVFGEY